jgi:hypothetical protein
VVAIGVGVGSAGRRLNAELVLAIAMIVLFALGGSIPAWTVAAGLAVLTVALCAAEGFTARAAAD